MPDLTIPEWLKANSPYHAIALLTLLAPNLASWSSPSTSTLTDLWNPTFLSIGITLLSFITSRNNISGPLRYGVHKYGPWMQTFYEKAPDGTIWGLMLLRFLLPWTQAWLIGVLSLCWQYILQHFREDVRNVTDQANNLCARVSIAVSTVHAHVAEASRYELDALTNGAQVLRDARQAEGIKASDFFSECDAAWTAIERAAQATTAAHGYSATALPVAQNARDSQSSYSNNIATANAYLSHTQTAANELSKAQNKAEVARDTISRFSDASAKDQEARRRERQNASRAVSGAKKIVEKSAGLSAASSELATLAQEVRHTASVAVAAVEQGRMDQAREYVEKAKKGLEGVEKEAGRIASVKSDVRQLYITQILG